MLVGHAFGSYFHGAGRYQGNCGAKLVGHLNRSHVAAVEVKEAHGGALREYAGERANIHPLAVVAAERAVGCGEVFPTVLKPARAVSPQYEAVLACGSISVDVGEHFLHAGGGSGRYGSVVCLERIHAVGFYLEQHGDGVVAVVVHHEASVPADVAGLGCMTHLVDVGHAVVG